MNENVLPAPSALSAQIRPRCASTIPFAIATLFLASRLIDLRTVLCPDEFLCGVMETKYGEVVRATLGVDSVSFLVKDDLPSAGDIDVQARDGTGSQASDALDMAV